ncbi:hypothetical protein [Microbacterium caowuchunii]|uniref:WXG100 family type VII secretion target n=1 Tax=Microbacterium caowuchunii TaxID=2614638 RepID=A0A5N0TMA8_9MICO|nr:hypothetical protein [Microbacterium caowuchunii]KAA9135454.1 hypothetical protein F6B40_02730 [Microbacterium caowuchunii]
MRVDYAQLTLSSAVLRRQSDEHVPAMVAYVKSHSVLTPSDTGIILLPFTGISLAVSVIGVEILEGLGTVLRTAADKVDGAAAAYAAQEQRTYEAAAQAMRSIGAGVPPFADPRAGGPTLPAAAGGAPAGHGDAEPWLFGQAYDAGKGLVTGTRGIVEDISSAADSWGPGPTGVIERQNPSSYLVTPNAAKSEIESMRWGAGPLLGGVDWVFEQVAGFSLLEDVIMKPFAGDWTGIEEVSLAWQHLGQASRAMADNAAGLVEQGEFWDGEAGLAFRGGMVALGTTMYGVGAACDSVSGTVGTLVIVSKAGAATIGFILNKISVKLLRIAAEAAIPIAGWIVAAVEGAILVTEVFSLVRLIYTVVDTIFDAIEGAVQARAQLVETLLLVEDLMQFLVNTGERYAR